MSDTKQTIDPKKVRAAMMDMLYTDSEIEKFEDPQEPPKNSLVVEGITSIWAFNPERVMKHKAEVSQWLLLLHPNFREPGEGGWSFLYANQLADGSLWTTNDREVESLVTLGLAVGMVEWCMDKELWDALPGGVPYFRVLIDNLDN